MGLFDLFGKGPLSEKKIAKIAALAANPYAQPDVRMREMQRLLNDGSPAALRGVLKRLTTNASGNIADEDEKKWLEDALADVGEDAKEPLREFIKTQDKLTYALRAYCRIAGDQESVGFFVEVLNHYGPDDYRSSEAKVQIIGLLSEHLQDERVLPALCPFLLDHSDEVRWAVIDLLDRAAHDGKLAEALATKVCENLAHFVTELDVGPRIQRRAVDMFAIHEWQVPGEATALTPLLDEDFFLDKKRFIRRRAKTKGA